MPEENLNMRYCSPNLFSIIYKFTLAAHRKAEVAISWIVTELAQVYEMIPGSSELFNCLYGAWRTKYFPDKFQRVAYYLWLKWNCHLLWPWRQLWRNQGYKFAFSIFEFNVVKNLSDIKVYNKVIVD